MEMYRKRTRKRRQTDMTGEATDRQAGNQKVTKTASDEKPPKCRVCERTGATNDANTFCVECNDHMCGNCARAHRGSRTSRRHQLLDKSQMPSKTFKARHMCDTHSDTPIEYYCKKQDQLLCQHCKTLNHQSCQGDDLITNVCGRVGNSNEFKKMYKGLKEIEQKITQHKSKWKANLTIIDTNHKKTKRDIDSFKNELYLFVDRLVDQMHEELGDVVNADKRMAAVNEDSDCDDVAIEVNDLITEIDIKKQSKDKLPLFIVMKTAKQVLEIFNNKMESMDSQNPTKTYNFEPTKQLRDIMGSIQKLGQLSKEGKEVPDKSAAADHVVNLLGHLPAETVQPREEKPVQSAADGRAVMHYPKGEPERTVANQTSELLAKGENDEYNCCITGVELLNEDHLAVTDGSNSSVKTLSLSQKRLAYKLQLSHSPWDITKISMDTLAVTCPEGRYIQLVSVSRSGALSLGRQIQVEGQCQGIQYSGAEGGRMVVCFYHPGKVQVIDMSGTVLKDLSSDSAGTSLFSWPRFVALSPDEQCVYVSDGDNASVTGITLDGRVVFTYRDIQLRHPEGLAVGDDGVIYVCDRWFHNIHMVSSEGRKIKVLLGERNEMRDPYGIKYNSADHKLNVGTISWNNLVLVFKLTQ